MVLSFNEVFSDAFKAVNDYSLFCEFRQLPLKDYLSLMHLFFIFFIGLLSVVRAQKVLWTDTLRYSNCTQITSMCSYDKNSIIAYGGFDEGYKGDWSNARTFMIRVGKSGSKELMDSSSTGGGPGPMIFDNHMYQAMVLGPVPKITGTSFPNGTYFVKSDLTGKLVWAKKQNFHGIPLRMSADADGSFYVFYQAGGGSMIMKYDREGNILSHPFPLGSNPTFDLSNNLFMTGYLQLRKFDPNGTLLWSKYAPNDNAIEVDNTGNCYIMSYDGVTMITKYDTDGYLVWSLTMPNTGNARMRIEGQNLYIVYTGGNGTEWGPNTVSKLDQNNGEVIWSVSFPFPEYKKFWPNTITSNKGTVYFSAYEPDAGRSATLLGAIEDLSYIPVTTQLTSLEDGTSIIIAPNPSSGALRVSYRGSSPLKSIFVTDVNGREVYHQSPDTFSGNMEETSLDMSDFPPGVYFVKCSTGAGHTVVKRVILQ